MATAQTKKKGATKSTAKKVSKNVKAVTHEVEQVQPSGKVLFDDGEVVEKEVLPPPPKTVTIEMPEKGTSETKKAQSVDEKPKSNAKKKDEEKVPKNRGFYSHEKCGLKVGDRLVFRKNPKIEGVVSDLKKGVKIAGVNYDGIAVSEEAAYTASELTPPKRLMGWGWDVKRGEELIPLKNLWEKLPIPAQN